MEKYGKHTEKTYREVFCTVIDWFHANFSLLMQVSKPTDRLANAIDPSYISKSGEQTTWTGKFWSGLSLYKWYADVIVRYKKELMDGPQEKRKGRPRQYDVFVDKQNLDTGKVKEFIMKGVEGRLFTFVGHHTAMKRNLRIVIWQMTNGKTKVFFSTDTEMSGEDVLAYYKTRFQIEFCFRDAKEFTGLCDCQARQKDKLDFAFNASLFAVNAAKVFRYKSDRSISMSTFKSLMVNQYLCKRIFSMSGFRPNMKIATNRM